MHLLVGGTERACNVFLACEDWKKPWNFWDAYMSLTWCSNMIQTKMKETGYSFSFTSLYWWVPLPPLLEWVFFSCVLGYGLKFSRIALLRKRLQLDSKSDLTTNGLILGFLLKNGFFRWLHICVEWDLQEMLNCYSFLTTSNFFDVLFEGYSGLFFKNACTFEP